MNSKFAQHIAAAILVIAASLGVAPAADEPKPEARDARQTVMAFLDAAFAGRLKEAAAMGEPGKAFSREDAIQQFAEMNVKNIAIVSVHADQQNALTITNNVKGDHDRQGPLVLTLVRKDGRWFIRDVDLETEASAKEELARFLKKYPDAKPLPDKQ
jgi:hypothetical protein